MNINDLSKFTFHELDEVITLLTVLRDQGVPYNCSKKNVQIVMDAETRQIFLSNDNADLMMINEGNLQKYFTCPVCQHQGFMDSLPMHNPGNDFCMSWVDGECK